MISSKSFVLSFLCFASLVFFQFIASGPSLRFVSYLQVFWQPSSDCKLISGVFGAEDPQIARISGHTNLSQFKICESKPFYPQGNFLTLTYSEYSSDREQILSEIQIISSGKVISRFVPEQSAVPGWQKKVRILLQSEAVNSPHIIRAIVKQMYDGELLIYPRVDFYYGYPKSFLIHEIMHGELAVFALSFLCSILLTSFLFTLLKIPKLNELYFVSFLILVSLLVQYRSYPFFHADEWYFLQRLKEKGVSSALLTHNEHLIPFFSIFYFAQYSVFKGYYSGIVLVSAVLNGCNGWLLSRFIKRILADALHLNFKLPDNESSFVDEEGISFQYIRVAAWLTALFFVVNGSHSESIQWGLAQSCILATTFAILSFNTFWEILKTGKISGFLKLSFFTIGTIFSFAIGFILYILYVFLFGLHWIFERGRINYNCCKKLVISLFLTLIFLSASYLVLKEGFKDPEVNQSTLPTFSQLISFTAVGSEFGTILRGIGLYPFANFVGFESYLLRIGQKGQVLLLLGLSIAGTVVSLLCLYLILLLARNNERRGFAALWFVSQVLIVLPMFIVALGRAQLGVDYSISFRYQEFPLIGLALMIATLITLVSRKMQQISERRIDILRAFGFTLIVLVLSSQFFIGLQFQHFSEEGREFRNFVSQQAAWKIENMKKIENGNNPPKPYLHPTLYSPFHKRVREPDVPVDVIDKIVETEKYNVPH